MNIKTFLSISLLLTVYALSAVGAIQAAGTSDYEPGGRYSGFPGFGTPGKGFDRNGNPVDDLMPYRGYGSESMPDRDSYGRVKPFNDTAPSRDWRERTNPYMPDSARPEYDPSRRRFTR
jgi:hypothetical protein